VDDDGGLANHHVDIDLGPEGVTVG